MRKLMIVLAALLLAGCSKTTAKHRKITWVLERVPTTDIEREAIAKHVQAVLGATPKSLAGSDQDWDDAINAAYANARGLYCRPTLWEYDGYYRTGRWRYAQAVEVEP